MREQSRDISRLEHMIQAMERIRRYTKGCHHARSPHFRTANFNVSERMIVGVILDKKISIDKNIFVCLVVSK